MAFTFIVSSLILLFYFVLSKRASGSKSLTLPPGPPKLPIVGNIHQLAGSIPHRAFQDLARKHGPIMHVQLGQISAIIISSPRLAKEVLKTHDIALADRPKSFLGEVLLHGNNDVALSVYGDYWRQMKKICSLELLSAKKVRSFSAIREQQFNGFMEFLHLSCGKPVDMHENITKLINSIVCISSFGKNCRQQQSLLDFLEELEKVSNGFHVADMFPDSKFIYVISGMRSKLMKLNKTIDKIFSDILEEHEGRKRDDQAHDVDLLEVLLRIKEEGGLEFPITNNHIKGIFVDILAGGTDTTSLTIEWAMTEMMRHPRVMDKAQADVREAFKGKSKITESDVKGLAYLPLVIKETLRLHPPFPLLLPHVCREQCRIDGYDIPLAQKLFINAYALSTDPEYWDDAKSFKPERFENTSVDFMGTNYQYIPFGSGRRMCPGITSAMVSLEFFLAQMLYYFDWKMPNGSNPKDIDMAEVPGLTVAKKVHLHLVPTTYALNS